MTLKNSEPEPVIAYILDQDQARSILRDLQRSINKGAKTILLINSPNPHEGEGGDVTHKGLSDVPVPEVFAVGTVFTVALKATVEEFLEQLEKR
jgi:hypothetical protein